MKLVNWNKEKAKILKKNRGIDLAQVAEMIECFKYVGVADVSGHPKQQMFLVNYENYMICVPFVEDSDEIFLKTAYKSRKINKIFKR